MATLLLVDDETSLLDCLSRQFQRAGHECLLAENGHEALQLIEQQAPALILLDLQLPDMSGFDLLSTIRRELPEIPTIMITAHAGVDAAVEAMKEGIQHYLEKPLDLDALLILVERELQIARTASNLEAYRRASDSLPPIVGDSPQINRLREQLTQLDEDPSLQPGALPCPAVLFYGEQGVGKSLLAHRMHCDGSLANRPLQQIDCANLNSESRAEEIFASLAIACGGTVVLEDIDQLPFDIQERIATALSTGKIKATDNAKASSLSVRLSATIRGRGDSKLSNTRISPKLIEALQAHQILIPPLRERMEDIEAIADYYGGNAGDVADCESWPGNVAELQHRLKMKNSGTANAKGYVSPSSLGKKS